MNKQIRLVDTARGICQITCVDERWYARPVVDETTGLPTSYRYVPSVTWICQSYPKGIGFYKWLANTGWDESQALKEVAGARGSKVHQAIESLLLGSHLAMDTALTNPDTAQAEPLGLEEYEAIWSFVRWHEQVKPVRLDHEFVVWNEAEGYAGTVDFLCEIDGQRWLIDFKTSQAVWPSHELQVSAYRHADDARLREARLGILQLGYARNKLGWWKFTEIEDQYDLFLATKQIWRKEHAGERPLQKDYPLSLRLTLPTPVSPIRPISPSLDGVAA